MSYIIPTLVAVLFVAIFITLKNIKEYMSEKNLYESNQSFKLELLNPESENVHAVLGISEKRSDEITEIVKKAYKEERYFTDTLESVVSQMEHINEVVFAVMIAGKVHNKGGSSSDMSSIETRLKMLELMQQLQKKS